MPSPQPSSVAVVTVTYNSSAIIADFLESVLASEAQAPEVYVVENNSPEWEATQRTALALGAHFRKLDTNLGYGGAVNAMIAGLPEQVTHVMISNPDLTIEPGTISELGGAVAASPACAAAGPRILNPDGSVYPSARNQPSLRTGLGHALFSGVWPSNPWSRVYRQELATLNPSERTVGWLSGACLVVDRAKFTAVGGFDEAFFMYFEDVELGRRFLDNGYTNLYVPTATITHVGGQSTQSVSARMIQAHHDSAYLFLSRRYSGPLYAPLRWVLKLALRVRAAWHARRSA